MEWNGMSEQRYPFVQLNQDIVEFTVPQHSMNSRFGHIWSRQWSASDYLLWWWTISIKHDHLLCFTNTHRPEWFRSIKCGVCSVLLSDKCEITSTEHRTRRNWMLLILIVCDIKGNDIIYTHQRTHTCADIYVRHNAVNSWTKMVKRQVSLSKVVMIVDLLRRNYSEFGVGLGAGP